MSYFFTFYRNGLLTLSIILSLFLWAVSSTLWAVNQKPQTIIIGLTGNGPVIVSDTEDKLSDLDAENFIRRFIALGFNYTSLTYVENMSLASDLMSEALFEKQKSEFQSVSETLKTRYVDQGATVSSIKRLEPNRYEIMVKTNQVLDKRNETFDTRVRVKIHPAERTTRNPWGLEIGEYSYERP
jgi:hypothetical protein